MTHFSRLVLEDLFVSILKVKSLSFTEGLFSIATCVTQGLMGLLTIKSINSRWYVWRCYITWSRCSYNFSIHILYANRCSSLFCFWIYLIQYLCHVWSCIREMRFFVFVSHCLNLFFNLFKNRSWCCWHRIEILYIQLIVLIIHVFLYSLYKVIQISHVIQSLVLVTLSFMFPFTDYCTFIQRFLSTRVPSLGRWALILLGFISLSTHCYITLIQFYTLLICCQEIFIWLIEFRLSFGGLWSWHGVLDKRVIIKYTIDLLNQLLIVYCIYKSFI